MQLPSMGAPSCAQGLGAQKTQNGRVRGKAWGSRIRWTQRESVPCSVCSEQQGLVSCRLSASFLFESVHRPAVP